jgi:hypothetical protein
MMRNGNIRGADAATRALVNVAVAEKATVAFAVEVCGAILGFERDIVGVI